MTDAALLVQVGLFALSFLAIWAGAGLIVAELTSLARSLKLSFFTLSFFLLGMMTSIPETAIGLTAVSRGEPEIFVGNLLGATLVLFLLVIPVLAMLGGGVSFPKAIERRQLIYTLIVCLAPAFLLTDRRIFFGEGILFILLYAALFLMFAQKKSIWENIVDGLANRPKQNSWRLLKLIVGLILLVLASNQIVNSTEYFSVLFNWSPFLVSLLIVSVGTNLPELSLSIRSVLAKRKDVALADYLGSAAANTLLFGILSLITGSTILVPNHSHQRLLFLLVGLVLFYFFARSRSSISRVEGFILMLIYASFVGLEIYFN